VVVLLRLLRGAGVLLLVVCRLLALLGLRRRGSGRKTDEQQRQDQSPLDSAHRSLTILRRIHSAPRRAAMRASQIGLSHSSFCSTRALPSGGLLLMRSGRSFTSCSGMNSPPVRCDNASSVVLSSIALSLSSDGVATSNEIACAFSSPGLSGSSM